METKSKSQEQKKITALYMGFTLVIGAQLVPAPIVQITALIMMLVFLTFLYSFRRKSEAGSLTHNHTDYLIRTFWIASLFMSIALILFCMAVWQYGDHTPFLHFIDHLQSGLYTSEQAIEEAYNQMIADYFRQNKYLLISAGAPTVGSSLIYLFYRLIKGFLCIKKNTPVEQVKSWF